jgi:hypothetical protein
MLLVLLIRAGCFFGAGSLFRLFALISLSETGILLSQYYDLNIRGCFCFQSGNQFQEYGLRTEIRRIFCRTMSFSNSMETAFSVPHLPKAAVRFIEGFDRTIS